MHARELVKYSVDLSTYEKKLTVDASHLKHTINQIVCDFLSQMKGHPLRILETHQGLGDATMIYRKYGCVVSFEINKDKFRTIRSRFPDAFCLDRCLEKHPNIFRLCSDYKEFAGYPIILPSCAKDCRDGMRLLIENGCAFDVIDVDPWGLPSPFIPQALKLLDNNSVLLVTSGEMHMMRFDIKGTIQPYRIRADPSLKSTRSFFRSDNILIVGAKIMDSALKSDIGLTPIFVYDYYTGHSGVQRLGFFVSKDITPSEKIRIRQQIVTDPILGAKLLRCIRKKHDVSVPWRFSYLDPVEKIENFIVQRMQHLCGRYRQGQTLKF